MKALYRAGWLPRNGSWLDIPKIHQVNIGFQNISGRDSPLSGSERIISSAYVLEANEAHTN